MKSLLVCLVLAAACELGHGEEYTINARRTSQTIAPAMSLVYMYYLITPYQNITFYKSIDEQNPCFIEAVVLRDDGEYAYETAENLQACGNNEYSGWDYVIVSFVEKNFFPEGCPVKKGSYFVKQDVEVTVNFPDKIECGDYTVIFNLYKDDEWGGQFEYSFTIPNIGNCIPT